MSNRLDRTEQRYTTDQVQKWFRDNAEESTANGEEKLSPDEIALRDKSGYYRTPIGRATGNPDDDEQEEKEERERKQSVEALMDAFDFDEADDLGINIKSIGNARSQPMLQQARMNATNLRARANQQHEEVKDIELAGPNGSRVTLDSRGRYRDQNNQIVPAKEVEQANQDNPDFERVDQARTSIREARRAEFEARIRERAVNGQQPASRWSHSGIGGIRLNGAFGEAAAGAEAPTTEAPAPQQPRLVSAPAPTGM